MAKKVRDLSDKAKEILKVLKENTDKELTLKEIADLGVEKPNGSHLKALENRELVTSRDVEIEVTTTRTVKAYSIVSKNEESE